MKFTGRFLDLGDRSRSIICLFVALVLLLELLLATALPAAAQPAPGPVRIPVPEAPAAALTAQDVTAWLDGYVPARLEAAGVVGAAVSVVGDGQVLTQRGYGSTDVRGNEPVDPAGTLFRAGSVSKLVTATAAMQLVQDGRLGLDTDVSVYLDFPLQRAFDVPITLRHLLTHTAGFEERVSPFFDPGPGVRPLRDVVAQNPPEQIFAPGTTPAYSNYGLSLVGYLVQRVSGQFYDDYVRQHVLDPLGMTSSTVAQPLPEPLRARMSNGYSDGGRTPVPFELISLAPAGALTTTADDMTRPPAARPQRRRPRP